MRVDSARAGAHLLWLTQRGMTGVAVSRITGVAQSELSEIRTGRRMTIPEMTHRAILSCQPTSAVPDVRPAECGGDRACYLRGCHNPGCVQAHVRYCKRLRYARLQGRKATVPADRARQHVLTLTELGMTLAEVADLAGLHRSTVEALTTRSNPAVKADTERRLLAIRPHADPTPAQVRALIVAGWPAAWIAEQVGVGRTTISRIAGGGRTRRNTRLRIAALAERVGDRRGPSRHAAGNARRLGYLPAAWYEPDWSPALTIPPGAPRDRAILTEIGQGCSQHDVAARYGLSRARVWRIYHDYQDALDNAAVL